MPQAASLMQTFPCQPRVEYRWRQYVVQVFVFLLSNGANPLVLTRSKELWFSRRLLPALWMKRNTVLSQTPESANQTAERGTLHTHKKAGQREGGLQMQSPLPGQERFGSSRLRSELGLLPHACTGGLEVAGGQICQQSHADWPSFASCPSSTSLLLASADGKHRF